MMNNDLVYLHRRAGEERSAAMKCANVKVREIHLELAQGYEFHAFILEQLAAQETGHTFAGKATERSARATTEDP